MPSYVDGPAWLAGPDLVYRRLAAPAVDRAAAALDDMGRGLSGARALDVGAGAGAASRALRERGALVVALDLSESMVRLAPAVPVVADAAKLPLRSECADVTVACCLLSHVDDPVAVLGELARVTRPGAVVAVTAFPAGDQHPVKAVVDGVLRECGYRPPDWYTQLKSLGETRVGSPVRLGELGTAAGLSTMDISVGQARLDDLAVDALVAWRLGMPAVTDWLATVDEREHAALRRRLALAITDMPPLQVLVATFTA